MEDRTAHVKEFYTLDQLAEEININKQSIRKSIRSGELTAYRVGNRYIVTRDGVLSWLEQNRVEKNQAIETE